MRCSTGAFILRTSTRRSSQGGTQRGRASRRGSDVVRIGAAVVGLLRLLGTRVGPGPDGRPASRVGPGTYPMPRARASLTSCATRVFDRPVASTSRVYDHP